MLIIPAIDLRQGRCVRLTQGRKEQTKIYDGDPVAIAATYETAGARMIHVVDLDAAFGDDNAQNRTKLAEIVGALGIPVQFGGGLRTITAVAQILELGASRLVIGTLANESPEIVQRLIEKYGTERIVVGIDAKNGQVMTHGWEQEESVSAIDLARRMAALGVERIVYTNVARDGMLQGVDIEATCEIARAAAIKVTASGGVSSLADLKRARAASSCGIDSVIVGKALYEGRFTLAEAIAASMG